MLHNKMSGVDKTIFFKYPQVTFLFLLIARTHFVGKITKHIAVFTSKVNNGKPATPSLEKK